MRRRRGNCCRRYEPASAAGGRRGRPGRTERPTARRPFTALGQFATSGRTTVVEAISGREPAHAGSEVADGSEAARLSVAGSEAVGTPEAADAIPTTASTLLEAVDFHARRHGDRVHVELYGSTDTPEGEPARITFAALVERAEHLAAGLADRGLAPGQSAALMLPTGLDYLATFLAVQMAGAIPVPIYPPARPKPARRPREAPCGDPRERQGPDPRHLRPRPRGLAAC